MHNVHKIIQDFLYLRTNLSLDKVISIVDTIAVLVTDMLHADFTALLYMSETSKTFIPVSICTSQERPVRDLHLLEEYWAQQPLSGNYIPEQFSLLDPNEEVATTTDPFAAANAFVGSYHYTYYEKETPRGTIVAYWREKTQAPSPPIDSVLSSLAQILVHAMSLSEERQQADNFSLRLAKLLTIFDLPLEELSFSELVEKILEAGRHIVPHAEVGIVVESPDSQRLNLKRVTDNNSSVADSVGEVVLNRVQQNEPMSAGAECEWIDLSRYFDAEKLQARAVKIVLPADAHIQCLLVVWTRRENGFSQNDLELLSVYALFVETVLSNALVVRKLKKSKQLLEKSTMRMADVEALAALGDMTSGLAHDFNNIFGGVIGRLQLMKLKVKDEAVLAGLDKIEALVLEGANTIKHIQEFSTSAKPKDMAPVDLSQVVQSCLHEDMEEWKRLAEEKHLRIMWETDVENAVMLGATPDLKIITHKLIENAVEHAPEHSTVTVSLKADERHFTLSVADNGPGIPEEIQPKIFYPFFSTKSKRGAGLGLAIVHGIVARHEGEITFTTSPQTGTVFTIRFKRADLDQDISEITRKTKHADKLRILIVDDDEQIREILTDMLTINGHNAVACQDGYDALKALEKNEYDMMITDLGMPGMSGLELADTVHRTRPHMPIAMITGWGTQLSQEEISSKGIRKVLSKPFHLKEVREMVEELVV